MPRIKDYSLATATASDEFLVIDGSTNGTRKLSAYSPTFGGNLTVSGGSVLLNALTGNPPQFRHHPVGTADIIAGVNGIRLLNNAASAAGMSLDANNDTTLSGNLTVSGSIVNQNGVIQSTLAAGALISSLSTNNNAVHGFQISGSGTGSRDWRLEQGRAGANSFSISNATGGVTTPLIVNGATDNILIGYSSTTSDGGQKLQVSGAIAATTGAANNALVARYNSSNSLFGVTVNSAGQGVVSENTDASTGSDKYSKTGLPAFRLGNTGGSGTVPFWIDVAASGTAGNAITWTNAFQIDSSQNATFAGTVYAGASSNIGWNGRAYLSALADGKVQVTNWANNGTSMLVLGAAASTSYPMLKRNGTGIDVRLADDSAFATFRALDFSAQGAATTVGANQVSYGGTTATTATAGAQTLPANPVGFIIVNVAGTTAKIPYYAN